LDTFKIRAEFFNVLNHTNFAPPVVPTNNTSLFAANRANFFGWRPRFHNYYITPDPASLAPGLILIDLKPGNFTWPVESDPSE
jgi:hypothetical protein